MQKATISHKTNLSQEQIVSAIKNNNEIVLKSLYTNNYHKVEYLVLNNNGSLEQAKDIFQEAYIAVWKNIKSNSFVPKNETAINGYLYTIAKNKWMDYLRSSEYKKKVSLTTLNHIQEEEDSTTFSESSKEQDQKLSLAMKAFKNLGNPCKELLTKFYFEKKSMKIIAEELSLDAASTRNKKYRCMQKLRELALNSN
jgi:RNA polymerase sigma factor (sigma-70 family)